MSFMLAQNRSLTSNIGINTSLTDFIEKEALCETINLFPIILNRSIVLNKFKLGLGKTRLNKVACYITTRFGTKRQKESVILYKYGPHLMNFDSVTHYLEENKIIKIDGGKHILTEFGISWISKKLSQFEVNKTLSKSVLDEVISEIDFCLFTDINTLIEKTLYSNSSLAFKKSEISGKRIFFIFDWTKYGTGVLNPYIYTLLYSYSRVEKYLKEKKNRNELDICLIDYSKIPNYLPTTSLSRTRKLKNIPLTSVFEKNPPPYLTEEKVEGKNYISNLWYIIEGVNILHALAEISPTISEISMLCLTNYQYAILNGDDSDILKKMRESLIRNDVNKLADFGILLKDKYNGTYKYKLSSTCYYDTILDRNFQIVDKEIIKNLYESKIKVFNSIRFE